MTLEPRRSVISPTYNEWSLMYHGMMVFISATLSKTAIQLSLFIFTLATFLIPYHHWKGSRFKKGVCRVVFMPQEPPSGGSLQHLLLSEGSRLSFIIAIPSFLFNCFLSLEVFTSRQLAEEMFRATTMVTAFLICLGIFHCPCQMDHELLCHPLDSTGIITLWVLAIASILFFKMCQVHIRFFQKWLVTLRFPQGKEASSPWLGGHQQFGFWGLGAAL